MWAMKRRSRLIHLQNGFNFFWQHLYIYCYICMYIYQYIWNEQYICSLPKIMVSWYNPLLGGSGRSESRERNQLYWSNNLGKCNVYTMPECRYCGSGGKREKCGGDGIRDDPLPLGTPTVLLPYSVSPSIIYSLWYVWDFWRIGVSWSFSHVLCTWLPLPPSLFLKILDHSCSLSQIL